MNLFASQMPGGLQSRTTGAEGTRLHKRRLCEVRKRGGSRKGCAGLIPVNYTQVGVLAGNYFHQLARDLRQR